VPRPLVFGNGHLLVQLDNKGRIRDFFWPEAGLRNHVSGHHHHIGICVDGRFSWTEWDEWIVTQRYLPKSLIGVTTFESSNLSLAIEMQDQVIGYKGNHDAFVRNLSITNLTRRPRQVEVFFSQDFRIGESEIGDTGMYRPDINAMVHFKWGLYFICSGKSEMGGIAQKTVGLRGFDGLQGTWKDAEDCSLQQRPIEQGSIDSTFSVIAACPPSGLARVEYRIDCTNRLPPFGSLELPEPEIEREHNVPVGELPPTVQELFDRSIRILLTQRAATGAIVAANDSDIMRSNRATYSYVWPRDGAMTAYLLDRISCSDLVRPYHHFALGRLSEQFPFFLHKYNIDGTFGATWHPWVFDGVPEVPMQEDETALELWSLHNHCVASGNTEWLLHDLEKIRGMANFLLTHIDETTGLPKPSYDLWEERRGVHTFTVATVIAGLEAAAKLLGAFGDAGKELYEVAAVRVRRALLDHLVDPKTGCFLRGMQSVSYQELKPDYLPDASLMMVGRFAGLPANHPAVVGTNAWIEKELWVHSPIAGVARYPNDYYGRVTDAYPGNPWIITTMWLAQEKIRAAKSRADLDDPLKHLNWVVDRAESTGVLGEQFHPDTGEVITVSPLTWSHAEFIATCLDWCDKHRELE
jgi:GH15 family glucan-1,4-alpha-glucosidase